MATRKSRMSDKLKQTRLIVEGARKPEPLQALIAFGYPEARLDEGLRYYQAAEQAYFRVQQEQTEAFGVQQQLKAAVAQAYLRYVGDVQIARAAFAQDQERLHALGGGWRAQTGSHGLAAPGA